MFSFLNMMGNYDSRKVNRYEDDKLRISTAYVSDGDHDYETAVCHPSYNDNEIVIVEYYDTKTQAQAGHDRWVKIMTAKKLPEQLISCPNSSISKIYVALGGKTTHKAKRK